MILNPLNWGRRKQDSMSVLDLDPSFYDLKTHLPANVQVGAYHTRPLVSLSDIHDHLVLLKALSALAEREGRHFHRLADSAAFEYERWAQYVLPLQRRRRVRRSGSTARSSSQMSRTGSGPASLPSPSSIPEVDLSSPKSIDSSESASSTPAEDPPKKRRQPTLAPNELPPLSVLMCWHAHLLNPSQFAKDSEGAYAALADLAFPFAAVAEAIRTGSLPGDVEHVPQDSLVRVPSLSGWMPPDISAAVQRQSHVIAAVKEAGWLEQCFIEGPYAPIQRCIVRYHAWLDLMAATKEKLTPTVDIELAWRTHQLKGARYRQDTQMILGAPLDQAGFHNDGMLKRTAELWGKRFRGHDYLGARTRPSDRMPGLSVLKPLIPNRRSTVP